MISWLTALTAPMEPDHNKPVAVIRGSSTCTRTTPGAGFGESVFASSSAACSTLSSGPGAVLGCRSTSIRDSARAGRQLVDHGHRLVLQHIRATEEGRHGQAERQRRANPARHMPPLHGINGAIERVEKQKPEGERRKKRLHELQQENGHPKGDDKERHCFGIELVERPHFGRRVRWHFDVRQFM